MTIPLRFTVPDGGIARFVVPMIFIGGGLGFLVWYSLEGPAYPGWQRYLPYAIGGFFILVGALRLVQEGRRAARREADARMLDEHRDAPWRVRPEWRRDELTASSTVSRSFAVFTVVWNLVSWPLAWFLIAGDRGEGDVWLVALFPLVGLGFLAKLVYEILRARKFGRTVVQLDPMPTRLGRPFRGTLRTKLARGAEPEDGFLVKVSCYRQSVRYTRDSDGDRRKRIERDLLWRDETRVGGDATMGGHRVEVRFAFDLPDGKPPSTPLKLENRILWEVAAEADLPGIDFEARVEVPVFPAEPGSEEEVAGSPADEGAASSEEAPGEGAPRPAAGATVASTPAPPAPVGDAAGTDVLDEPRTEGIVLLEEPHLFELHFTAARNRRGAILMGIFGGAFFLGGFPLTAASGFMGLIFIGVGGLLVYGSIQQGTNDTVLRVQDGRIRVTHDGIGMPADVDLPVDRVEDVLVHLGTTSESARYSITLLARAGEGLEHLEKQAGQVMGVMSKLGMSEDHPAMEAMRKGADQPRISVASGLADKDEADWLALRIEQAVEREMQRPT